MTGFQEWRVDQPWLDTHCSLGEGPFYDKLNGTVRFVDIKKKRIHQVPLDKDISNLKTVQLDVAPTVTSNIVGVDPRETILIGVKYGIALLNWETGSYTMIQRFPSNERLRSNDGASDPHGRFWVGTMTDFDFGDCAPEGMSAYTRIQFRMPQARSHCIERPVYLLPSRVTVPLRRQRWEGRNSGRPHHSKLGWLVPR